MPNTQSNLLAPAPTPALAPLAVSVAEAGRLLGISERAAWTLADEGKLKSFRIGQRRLIAVKHIEEFIEKSTEASSEVK